jgi:hypothetical protein
MDTLWRDLPGRRLMICQSQSHLPGWLGSFWYRHLTITFSIGCSITSGPSSVFLYSEGFLFTTRLGRREWYQT